MDSVGLEQEIQTEFFEQWRKELDGWHRVKAKLEVHDTTMKILRRIANG
mgnify:CR=1 FL=1